MVRRFNLSDDPDLTFSSREEGEKLRERILASLAEHDYVEVDFGAELVASASFLDEALAKLIDHIPATELKLRVRLLNFSEQDRRLLNMLTATRIREQEPLHPGEEGE